MANSYSTSDIMKVALHAASENTDGTSPYQELALQAVNQLHLDLISGSSTIDPDVGTAWTWARAKNPISLVMYPPIETGGVTLTNGSTAGTLSFAPTYSIQGWYLKIDQRPDFFKILAHSANSTAFTIDVPYPASSFVNGAFRAVPVTYDLGSNIQRLVAPIQVYRGGVWANWPGEIRALDLDTLMSRYPISNLMYSMPEYFAVEYQDEESFLIRFSGCPKELVKIDIPYIPIPEDLTDSMSSIPLMPRPHKAILENYATHVVLVRKGDNKASYYLDLVKAGIRSMQKKEDRQISQANSRRGQIYPRQDQLFRLRDRGGRYLYDVP